jgi:hypothetical protein
MDPETQAKGTAAASAARTAKAAERRAILEFLESAPLTSPEEIRAYLEVVLRASATGQIPPTAGGTAAKVASGLLNAHHLSIKEELADLRKAREFCESHHQHQTGVSRRRR